MATREVQHLQCRRSAVVHIGSTIQWSQDEQGATLTSPPESQCFFQAPQRNGGAPPARLITTRTVSVIQQHGDLAPFLPPVNIFHLHFHPADTHRAKPAGHLDNEWPEIVNGRCAAAAYIWWSELWA